MLTFVEKKLKMGTMNCHAQQHNNNKNYYNNNSINNNKFTVSRFSIHAYESIDLYMIWPFL